MAKGNGHNVANGIVSGIVLICGIIFSVLIWKLFSMMVESVVDSVSLSSHMDASMTYARYPVWSFGFSFIVPGLIGVLSACTKSKGAFITHMVFSIITLLVMGIFFIAAIGSLGSLAVADPSRCYSSGDFCKCSHIQGDLGFTCEEMSTMYGMAIGLCVVIVIGWILTLVGTILSGILACRREDVQQGYVVQRMPTTTVVQLAPTASMPPAYRLESHDKAELVQNVQY